MNDNYRIYHQHISSKRRFLSFRFREIFKYKDLIRFYMHKNIVTTYRQTVLGPVWLFLSPFLNSLLQMFIFGYLAGFKTGGVPKIIFYLFSNTAWQLYSRTVNSDSQIFSQNVNLFGKVFFPRLTISYANLLSAATIIGAQTVMNFIFFFFFLLRQEVALSPAFLCMIVPMAQLALLGQGTGLLYAAVMVRYRDLRQVFPVITRVLMYVSPVVYPLSQIQNNTLRKIMLCSPFCAPLELLRAVIWNAPYPPVWSVVCSFVLSVIVNVLGILVFHYVEKDFVDSI